MRAVAQQVGRAEPATTSAAPMRARSTSTSPPGLDGAAQERAEAGIRALTAATPGATFSLKALPHRADRGGRLRLHGPVVISVYGADLDRIEAAARDVAREVAEVRGAADVQLRAPAGLPQITISRSARATCAIGGSTPSRCWNSCGPPTRATRSASPMRAMPCSTSW